MQLACEHDQSVLLSCGLLRLSQAVLVTLAVAELECVLGRDARADLDLVAGIQKAQQPLARAHAHVMTAFRAHVEVALELGPIQDRITRRTLDPQSLRHGAGPAFGLDARRHDFFEPRHERS